MQVTNDIQPQFEVILSNEHKYSIVEVKNAKKQQHMEQNAATSLGLSIEQYRLQNRLNLMEYSKKMLASDEELITRQNIDLKEFGRLVHIELHAACAKKGGHFIFHDDNTKHKYLEVIRYMFDSPTETIVPGKFLYLFGRYGNGKSLLLKSCYKVLKKIRKEELNWSYFHIPTLVNKALSEQSIKAFDVLFNCKKNMILDEFGDVCEKQKIYGQEQIPMRQLILDVYDKWISNNGTGQKLAITSNLFPDASYYYHERLNATTLHEFYDEKLLNKMQESFNIIRFPNVSFRDNNVTKML